MATRLEDLVEQHGVLLRDAMTRLEARIGAIGDDLHEHALDDERRHAELTVAVCRIPEVEARVERIEERFETTGRHQIETLTEQMADLKRDRREMGRHWSQLIVAVLLGVIGAAAGYLAH